MQAGRGDPRVLTRLATSPTIISYSLIARRCAARGTIYRSSIHGVYARYVRLSAGFTPGHVSSLLLSTSCSQLSRNSGTRQITSYNAFLRFTRTVSISNIVDRGNGLRGTGFYQSELYPVYS